MHATPADLLGVGSIRRILTKTKDPRLNPENLRGLNAVNLVPASDDEITMYVGSRVPMAQIILDGANATPVPFAPNETQVNSIVDLISGYSFTPPQIRTMNRLFENVADEADADSSTYLVRQTSLDLNASIAYRINYLVYAAWIDSLAYDVNGVKIQVSWGKPADLKATAGTLWSDPSSTPVQDINDLRKHARITYGVAYDIVEMSQSRLDQMVVTDEFKVQARLFLNSDGLPISDFTLQQIAERVLGLRPGNLIINDDYAEEFSNGAMVTGKRFLPENTVLLRVAADAKNDRVMDFGNGLLTEAMLGAMAEALGLPNPFGALPRNSRGPLVFPEMTVRPAKLNLWGVLRGFVRFYRTERSAVLYC